MSIVYEQILIKEIHKYDEWTIDKQITIKKMKKEIGHLVFTEDLRDKDIYIAFIKVEDQYQRQGYGTKLLKELEKYAKENQFKKIKADVLGNFEFWTKNGFKFGRKGHFDITWPCSKEIL